MKAQNVFIGIFILAVVVGMILMSNNRDKALMEIEYCWDSFGNHYVAPSESCTH